MLTINTTADLIIKVLIAATMVGNVAFLINYATRSRWRATTAGKLFFYVFCVGTALLLNNGLTYFFQDYPGRDVFRFTVYGGLLMNSVVANAILIRRQRDGRAAVREYMRELNSTLAHKSNRELDDLIDKLAADHKANPTAFLNPKEPCNERQDQA